MPARPVQRPHGILPLQTPIVCDAAPPRGAARVERGQPFGRARPHPCQSQGVQRLRVPTLRPQAGFIEQQLRRQPGLAPGAPDIGWQRRLQRVEPAPVLVAGQPLHTQGQPGHGKGVETIVATEQPLTFRGRQIASPQLQPLRELLRQPGVGVGWRGRQCLPVGTIAGKQSAPRGRGLPARQRELEALAQRGIDAAPLRLRRQCQPERPGCEPPARAPHSPACCSRLACSRYSVTGSTSDDETRPSN
jgi:hypothetical protein